MTREELYQQLNEWAAQIRAEDETQQIKTQDAIHRAQDDILEWHKRARMMSERSDEE